MFEKVSRKFGFTTIEIKVILFLLFTFLIGFSIKIFKDNSLPEYRTFDYSKEDSLFNYYKTRAEQNRRIDRDTIEKKAFEYKQEVLNLEPGIFADKIKLPLPAEKSININIADLETLIRLPGIGEKTAQKIIDLRNEKGNFGKLEELLDVKGIGNVKFNKIKKFLYIK
jgi:competence ComEA-like helix-hairpin-helix protein